MIEEAIKFIKQEDGFVSTRSSLTSYSRKGIALSTRGFHQI
jgi:hypothetical protein